MLTSAQNIAELIEAMEVRFLANRDDNLHFALLTDFRDASAETLPEDEALLRLAQKGIESLNIKYSGSKGDRFFLFHRPRRWNFHDRVWMGYERKRGKLADLNALLRAGNSGARFSVVVGDTTVLSNVKYVITLDTDTQLPRDAARQFVGAMAHPLNRARYDRDRGRVCEGYGILQPRVAVSLPGMNRSRYAAMCGSDPGIDPYTRAVSDVYQDLFGEGSFIGKGIYDVDAFELALKGRFPENRILSHDLLEGCYARAGLLSDVQLYEEHPSRYSADVSRRHRWIRGDWQLVRWLLPGVPGPDGHLQKNPLSAVPVEDPRQSAALSRARGADAFIAAGLDGPVVGLVLDPRGARDHPDSFGDYLPPGWASEAGRCSFRSAPGHHPALRRQALRPGRLYARMPALRGVFQPGCNPAHGWRMLVSHRRLLEWNPSGDPERNRGDLIGAFRTLWFAPALATATVIALPPARPAPWGGRAHPAPLVFSPAISWWISRPLVRREARLTTDQTLFLRTLSRKTWAFFETFVGPEDHWLPPDNFQEHPSPVVAHRTSPTNMGLSLLANLSAYDFGYLSAGQLIERTENAFHTMEALERYQGHFYNWYDTQSLKPLPPLYISSVDSGNLAGHLLTLRPGLLALPDQKILGPRLFEGLGDTLKVLAERGAKPLWTNSQSFKNC